MPHDSRFDNLLVWGGFLKSRTVDGSFTWPTKDETEVGGSGDFDYGDSIPVRLGELVALGSYVQRYTPYSDWLRTDGTICDFWPTGTISLRVDQVSARAIGGDTSLCIYTHSGQYIPIFVPDLTSTDCKSDPSFSIPFSHSDVNVDVPYGLSGRPSAWDSVDNVVTGGEIDTTASVTVSPGTFKRVFASGYEARNTTLIADENWAWYPWAYMVRKANGFRALFGTAYGTHDLYVENAGVATFDGGYDENGSSSEAGPNGQTMKAYEQSGVGTNWIYWKDDMWVLGGTKDDTVYAYSGAINADGDGAPLPANAWTTVLYGYDPAPTIKPGLGGLGLDDEDVTFWLSHRYLEIECAPASGPLATGVILDIPVIIKYKTEAIYDNHQDSTIDEFRRQVSVELSEEQEVSYTARASGSYIWLDLWTKDRPDLQHVTEIEITIPDGYGDWELSNVWLREHNSNDPDYTAQNDHAYITMHEALRAYVSGGARSTVDGISLESLASPANFNVFSSNERLLEMIWWFVFITEQNTTDQSAMWSLENYLQMASYCCEGWSASLPGNWENMTVDEDGDVLTNGYSCDIIECQQHNADGDDIPGGLKAREWATVPGILYKPHGVLVVQGGIHGMASQRSSCCVEVKRREEGSGNPWVTIDNISSDGHGYWLFPDAGGDAGDVIARYDGESPIYWEHLVTGTTHSHFVWSPIGTYSDGRIGDYEGITCRGNNYDFAIEFWKAKYGASFVTGWGSMSLDNKKLNIPSGARYISGSSDLSPGDLVVGTYGGAIIHDADHMAYTNKTGNQLGWFGDTVGISGVFRMDWQDADENVFSRIYERQKEWAYVVLGGFDSLDFLHTIEDDWHICYLNNGDIYVASLLGDWATTLIKQDGDISYATLKQIKDGKFVLIYEKSGNIIIESSDNSFNDFLSVSQIADRRKPMLFIDGNRQVLACEDASGNTKILTSCDLFENYNEYGVSSTGEDKVDDVIVMDDGRFIYAVLKDSTIEIYSSEDGGRTSTLVKTITR